jgi:hypothetical protein
MTEDALQLQAQLRTFGDYQAERPLFFPSVSSLEWFVRQNRAELVKASALLKLTGRWFIIPAAFDSVLLAVTARKQQRA